MIFTETKLAGAFVIEPERLEDMRGFFARLWSERDFAEHGLVSRFVESNTSFSAKPGTLRGMHYQAAPHGQVKLVRCTAGAIYDVIVDLRPNSPTYKKWESFGLSAENRLMLYVPIDIAHGFQTLIDGTEVTYQMSSPYEPASSKGVRWDDPAFGIDWPEAERVIIARDQEYPDFIG
ncbi:MAG TPA: dTDP-4-dehydrorhamnose 3,5-epimerase [Pyrinomonadaceae bacterium]|nr:dTDP-4-dehydrorhamnose 3,5-epimerase [Pyrinomonadaceae bacterium]